MWSSVFETVLKMLAVLLPSLISYQAGKTSVKSDLKDNSIKDAAARKEIDDEIVKTHSDTDARQRMRDKWSQ